MLTVSVGLMVEFWELGVCTGEVDALFWIRCVRLGEQIWTFVFGMLEGWCVWKNCGDCGLFCDITTTSG